MPTTKKSTKSSTTKKSASKPAAGHPSWADMIKECIIDHPEEARSGVSRPQIKKYVETKYGIQFGAAQVSQLNKAIAHGAEKGTFVLPKGLSGKVKLPPKRSAESTATKENKPAPAIKPTAKTTAKPKSKTTTTSAKAKPTTAKTAVAKKGTAAKAATKPAAKSSTAAKKASVRAKKAPAPARKAPAKKAATGTTKAKTAAAKPKAPAKKATKSSSTKKA